MGINKLIKNVQKILSSETEREQASPERIKELLNELEKKDKKLHSRNYSGVKWVGIIFIIFLLILFYIKYLLNQMAILQGNQIVLETKIDEQIPFKLIQTRSSHIF